MATNYSKAPDYYGPAFGPNFAYYTPQNSSSQPSAPTKTPIPASGPTTAYASNPTNYNAGHTSGSTGSSTGYTGSITGDDQARQAGFSDFAAYQLQQSLEEEARNRENKLRSTIESGFNDINRQLDEQAGLLPGWEAEDTSRISDSSAKLKTGIEDAYGNAQKTLDLSKGQIQSSTDKSVMDIQNSLRGLLRNAYQQVGAVGAGNSSAAQTMLPYAFSKLYGQQRGAIQGQANSQFTELAKKELDVQTTFAQQKSSIDQWESEQLGATRDKYRGMLMDIQSAKMNASGQRLAALQALETNLLTNAQNELSRMKTSADNFRQQLQGWVVDRMGQLSNLQLELKNSANFSPRDIVYNEMQGIGSLLGGGASSFSPIGVGRKKDEF